MYRFIGVDPGKTGGVVVISETGVVEHMEVMDDVKWFSDFIKSELKTDKKTTMVFMEKAQSFPRQGLVSTFNYAQGFGELVGVLIAHNAVFELVPPQAWTKVMHAGANGDRPKQKSREVVKRLFPDMDFREYTAKAKQHDGLIDALLIAEFGRRKWVKSAA